MADRLKPLRGDGAKLLKLVTEAQDLQTLEQALELGNALGQPAEGLLDGVEVSGAGDLLPSSRFRGTQASQPALNLLLIHQLSLALEGTPEAGLRRSVRRLNLVCRILPALRGFDGLESLAIEMVAGTQWTDLSPWGSLPALRSFALKHAGTKDQPCSLASLDGLHAPQLQVLRVGGLGLTSVEALSDSPILWDVDLSQNPGLQSIRALAPAASTLQSLNLTACGALSTIDALKGASALQTLHLKDCAHLRSLEPLSASVNLTLIDLAGCARLESLQGLVARELEPSHFSIFSLDGCAALTSLRGLPPLSAKASTLYLQEMPALASLEGIEAARGIETLEIDNAALTDLSGLEHLSSLAEVRVIGCKDLRDIRVLGQLPALVRARLYGCSALQHLPSQWGQTLRDLELTAGVFTALGQLPASLKELDVRGVASLQNLKGVETATSLQVAAVDTFLQDASALQGLPQAYLRCFVADVLPQRPITPAWLHAVAGRLNPLRLDLRFTSVKELQVLVDFPNLHAAQVSHQACEFYQLKGGEYLTESAVRTLQRAICKKHQLATPEFLKARRTSNQAVVAGGPSLADLKRGLTSTDFGEIVEALQALRATGSASLYDAVVEGVSAPTLYTGDTAALGKLFKNILAPYRPWARWALTHVLMDAPDDATRAVALRESLQSIVLTVSLAYGQDPSRPLPLARFKALQSITLHEIPGNDLSFLREAGPLKSITLRAMSDLTSLETLGAMATLPMLQTLRIERCPALVSLKGLEAAAGLTHLVVDGSEQLGDFAAMAGLRSLQSFPRPHYESVDLSNFTALNDLAFAAGLQATTSLQVKLTGRVDLSPLASLPHLQSVNLELDTLDQDFSTLVGQQEVCITLIDPKTGYELSPIGKTRPEHHHVWSGEFPHLQKLKLNGGQHDFSQWQAPSLTTFESWGRLPTLRGVGHASQIQFRITYCDSLEGLEGSLIESLDLHYHESDAKGLPSIQVLHQLPALKTLRIAPLLTDRHAKDLVGCAQIQELQANSYSGSLAFLAGWESLARLDLRNSGELTDLDVLCELPSLARIRLRGSAMKRETWPKALQDRLDFMSS